MPGSEYHEMQNCASSKTHFSQKLIWMSILYNKFEQNWGYNIIRKQFLIQKCMYDIPTFLESEGGPDSWTPP